MCRIRLPVIFLLVIFVSFPVLSQSFWKWEPHISLTWYSSDRWSFHSDFGSLQTLSNKVAEDREFGSTERFEIQGFSTYRLFSGDRISFGLLHRTSDPFESTSGSEFRLIQQFAFVFHRLPFRIVNRIRTEQRFRSNEFLKRIRYRFSYDVPLNGDELDVGESFLKTTNEILFAFNDETSDWENRTTVTLGWLLRNRNKFELGLQYRINDIGTGVQRGGVHLITNLYLSIINNP